MHIGKEPLIGKYLTVHEQHISGKVIDETKNTITILSGNKKKIIEKSTHTFLITIDNQKLPFTGSSLVGKPEERIRKKLTK